MRLLSDTIEEFIKTLLEDDEASAKPAIEVRRNELAEHFQCAPSQINYVLATRFTPEHGYVIESRRGGGGYIRIIRIATEGEESLLKNLYEGIGTSLSGHDALRIIETLKTHGVVDENEAKLMAAALNPMAVSLPLGMKDAVCAGTMRSMLIELAKRNKK